MAEERDPDGTLRLTPPAWITGGLWAIAGISLLLIPLVFFLPIGLYWLIGNTLEVIVAGFCMLCCLYLYRFMGDRVIFSLAAFAFFGYALSNLFWYLYSVTFGRAGVYISVAEIGFFCFYLFFISAITIEFPAQEEPALLPWALFLFLFAIPVTITAAACLDQPLRILLAAVSLLLVEQLIAATIRHGVYRYPVLCAGIALTCAGDILYVIRETLVLNSIAIDLPGPIPGEPITLYHFLSIVGPLTIGSFALIVLGLATVLLPGNEADSDPGSGS